MTNAVWERNRHVKTRRFPFLDRNIEKGKLSPLGFSVLLLKLNKDTFSKRKFDVGFADVEN